MSTEMDLSKWIYRKVSTVPIIAIIIIIHIIRVIEWCTKTISNRTTKILCKRIVNCEWHYFHRKIDDTPLFRTLASRVWCVSARTVPGVYTRWFDSRVCFFVRLFFFSIPFIWEEEILCFSFLWHQMIKKSHLWQCCRFDTASARLTR